MRTILYTQDTLQCTDSGIRCTFDMRYAHHRPLATTTRLANDSNKDVWGDVGKLE